MTLPTIDKKRLPRHVGIIMDGNGRWARQHRVTRAAGHEAGAKSVRAVIEASREIGIPYLSLYAFSTENWRRSKTEVSALFRLLGKYVELELQNIHKQDIRVTLMGRREGLPIHVLRDLDRCVSLTAQNRSMVVNIAVNYGSHAEIADAAKAIAQEVRAGALDPNAIDEECVSRHLYVPELPELDLLIRTGGEVRVSNFMLWQLSYAEIVVAPILWPDFLKQNFYQAIADFQTRQRRFGGRKGAEDL